MNLRAALAKVFGMAAIFAVLAFASTAAEAHGGHVHAGSAPVVLALQAPAQAVSIDNLSARLEQALHDSTRYGDSLHDHGTAELRSAPATVPADDRAGCIQSCCAGAPCHSGAAYALGSEFSVVLPRDAGIGLAVGTAPGIAGHDPEGLRKPPKSFA
jgi:hypothetical protein